MISRMRSSGLSPRQSQDGWCSTFLGLLVLRIETATVATLSYAGRSRRHGHSDCLFPHVLIYHSTFRHESGARSLLKFSVWRHVNGRREGRVLLLIVSYVAQCHTLSVWTPR